MKNKKKVLLSSMLTIAMSASLAVSGTYALFTSQDEVNIAVTSGTVAVTASVDETTIKLYSMEQLMTGKFENGGTAEYDATAGVFTLENVTPGDMVTFTVDVTNESNVAIVYRVHTFISGELASYLETEATFNGVTGPIKKDVSDWKPVAAYGAIESIPMSIALPVEAPDEAQAKSATVSVTVEAVQGNGAASLIPEGDEVVTPENINDKLANANEDDTIALTAGYYPEIVVTQHGLTFTAEPGAIVGFVNVNAKDNCTFDGIEFNAEGAQKVYRRETNSYVNIYANIVGTGEANKEFAADNLTIQNCTFTGTFTTGDYRPITLHERARANGPMQNLTVDNCVFDVDALCYIYGNYMGTGEHKITNNTFGKSTATSGNLQMMSTSGNITMTGNTFYACKTLLGLNANVNAASVTLTVSNNNFVKENVNGAATASILGLRYYVTKGATVVVENNKANGGAATFSAGYDSGNGYTNFDIIY